jgi:hypothetical protein
MNIKSQNNQDKGNSDLRCTIFNYKFSQKYFHNIIHLNSTLYKIFSSKEFFQIMKPLEQQGV